jgi:hypothetical protein
MSGDCQSGLQGRDSFRSGDFECQVGLAETDFAFDTRFWTRGQVMLPWRRQRDGYTYGQRFAVLESSVVGLAHGASILGSFNRKPEASAGSTA